MGFLSEGLEPLREAQEQLLLRLDSMLVELRGMSATLSEVRNLLAAEKTRTIDLEAAQLTGGSEGLVN